MNRLSLFVLLVMCSGSVSKAMERDSGADEALFQHAQNYLNSRLKELQSNPGVAAQIAAYKKEREAEKMRAVKRARRDKHELVELFDTSDPIVKAARRELERLNS